MNRDDIRKIAKSIKIERLKQLPGMDEVAIKLNCGPTHNEEEQMIEIINHIEAVGFKIIKD